jgi:hypothetical protein
MPHTNLKLPSFYKWIIELFKIYFPKQNQVDLIDFQLGLTQNTQFVLWQSYSTTSAKVYKKP